LKVQLASCTIATDTLPAVDSAPAEANHRLLDLFLDAVAVLDLARREPAAVKAIPRGKAGVG
jgi:hypothetical protein